MWVVELKSPPFLLAREDTEHKPAAAAADASYFKINDIRNLEIAKEADGIAQQRYKTSIETFLIGKINTLDLNDAQNAKDEARRKHISELYYYWYYFYQIRSLTLWDFQANTELEADFDEIVRQ